LTEVNAGPAAVMSTFLKDKKDAYDAKYKKQLTLDFTTFLKVRT